MAGISSGRCNGKNPGVNISMPALDEPPIKGKIPNHSVYIGSNRQIARNDLSN